MKRTWRRSLLAAALPLIAVGAGLLVAGTAHAQTVSTGSLSFSGDQGDYISQGDSYAYSTRGGDGLSVSSSTGSTVSISVNARNGDWWTLDFDAPGTQVLTVRTYTGAHRHPFNGTGPGLSLSGEGRGCNELTGSFTVTKAVFGRGGYVQAFDATFEQHCEGGATAARGKVHISNPAPPRESAKPSSSTRQPAATASRHATHAGSRATPKSARPTPTSPPAATTPGNGNAGVDDTAKSVQAAPKLASDGVPTGRLLIALGIVALVGLLCSGVVATGIVIYVRGR